MMMKGKEMGEAKVALVCCETYEETAVYQAMKKGMDLLGGIRRFVRPDEKILVKPNFLSAAEADQAVTTHPAVMRGMFRILQEAGCTDVLYGDSPGHGSCRSVAARIGVDTGEQYGARMAEMSEEVLVKFEEGMTAREFHFAKEVTEADAIINLCKMKTHMLERVTGAVKNLYGLICGYRKAAGHVKYANATVFARALADIHRCVKPRLHVMDGIVAMEGNGPGSGDPVPMKVLLFSEDPVALDTVFCSLVYLNPESVPTNTQGAAMGIGIMDEERIAVLVPKADRKGREALDAEADMETLTVKEAVQRFGNPAFDVDRQGTKKSFLSSFSEFMTSISRRPVIDRERCIKCGICVNHCPVPGKAVDFKRGKNHPPVYDYDKCIRCYCCQEMCPQSAIHVRGQKIRKKKGRG